jgi:hypothetical protein
MAQNLFSDRKVFSNGAQHWAHGMDFVFLRESITELHCRSIWIRTEERLTRPSRGEGHAQGEKSNYLVVTVRTRRDEFVGAAMNLKLSMTFGNDKSLLSVTHSKGHTFTAPDTRHS